MPLTVLVDREDRIAINHAGDVDPLVLEADISATPQVWRPRAFSFGGWTLPEARTVTDVAEVLTPPTSVRALANSFTPVLHPTVGR